MQANAVPSEAYFEPKINAHVIAVLPGKHRVISDQGIALSTLLGSCVAACIRDVDTGIGGLNHFLLPDDEGSAGASGGFSARYGVHAMELLINEILKLGGRKDRLEAKAFGGSNVIASRSKESVGDRNVKFVQNYLRSEGIRLSAADFGGERARRIYFFPGSGHVSVNRLPVSESIKASKTDQQLQRTAVTKPKAGGVELF